MTKAQKTNWQSVVESNDQTECEQITTTILARKIPEPPKRVSLSPSANELQRERDKGIPIWIRAPKSGPEHYSGFTRSKLYELATHGRIRSVSIREPGRMKGVRLFHLDSILRYVEGCEVVVN